MKPACSSQWPHSAFHTLQPSWRTVQGLEATTRKARQMARKPRPLLRRIRCIPPGPTNHLQVSRRPSLLGCNVYMGPNRSMGLLIILSCRLIQRQMNPSRALSAQLLPPQLLCPRSLLNWSILSTWSPGHFNLVSCPQLHPVAGRGSQQPPTRQRACLGAVNAFQARFGSQIQRHKHKMYSCASGDHLSRSLTER